MPGALMLLDAPSMYFRAFHGVPTSVQAADGTPVNAVRGFLDAVAHLVSTRRPARLVACLDADWRPAFRVAALPSYKAHRVAPDGGDGTPPELAVQVPVIEQVLAAVGVATVGVAGFEADDVIGTLAERADGAVEIVTGDRDLFQLVRDDRPVRVLYTGAGMARIAVVDEAEITRRYGIPGRTYVDFAVLRGDPSDGLPGVPGVGEKSAAELVRRFGGVTGLLAALDAGDDGLSPTVRRRVLDARDYLDRAVDVVRVVRDVPTGPVADELPGQPADPATLVGLADRWRLDSALNRLLAALGGAVTPGG
jgi:5'-3' exonuclease